MLFPVPILVGSSSISIQNGVQRVTVQNNDLTPPPQDPNGGAILFYSTSGGHVVRNNKISFTHEFTQDVAGTKVHGSDCIVGLGNKTVFGGFSKDSDIYNNLCDGATDDAISIDGGGINNRIWGNTIIGSATVFSAAPVVVGPTYVFRNIGYNLRLHWLGVCLGIKEGENGTGATYFYHNTFYIPDTDNKCVYNMHFDENGLTDSVIMELGIDFKEFNNPANPNAFVQKTGQEKNGLYAKATFVNPAGGDFRLAAGSEGIDKGVEITGFNDANSAWPSSGTAPDIGAFEIGSTQTPPPSSSPPASPTQTPSNPGDFNTNGTVEIDDYTIFVEGYGQDVATLDIKHKRADLNTNGTIDLDDYTRFVGVFNTRYF